MRSARACSCAMITCCMLLLGCEGVTDLDGNVELRTDRATYRMNEQVVLELTNNYAIGIIPGPSTILCQPVLQQRVHGSWADAGRLDGACHMIHEPRGVAPGATVKRAFGIAPAHFVLGQTYRFAVEFGLAGEGNEGPNRAFSSPFSVEE